MRFGQGSCCAAALHAATLWDFFLGWGNKDVWSSTQWTLSAEWVVGLCFRRLMYDRYDVWCIDAQKQQQPSRAARGANAAAGGLCRRQDGHRGWKYLILLCLEAMSKEPLEPPVWPCSKPAVEPWYEQLETIFLLSDVSCCLLCADTWVRGIVPLRLITTLLGERGVEEVVSRLCLWKYVACFHSVC